MDFKNFSVAAIMLIFGTSAVSAENVSIERKIDCAGEFAATYAILKVRRDDGYEVPFLEIPKLSEYGNITGYNIGVEVRSLEESERKRYMELLENSLNSRMQGLLRQIAKKGVDASLSVAKARSEECLAELGSFALSRL